MYIEMHYIIHMLYIGMYILWDTKFSLLRGVSAIEICGAFSRNGSNVAKHEMGVKLT